MSSLKYNPKPATLSLSDWKTSLERKLINTFLHDKGYSVERIMALPISEARLLMIDACTFASLKLAEIESRAGFTKKISARPF